MAATSQNIIRTLTIKSTVDGADKTKADLKGIQSAHEQVARTTETSAKGQLSLADSVSKAERRFNSALRSQQDFEKVQRQMNAAVAQNPALQARANEVIRLAGDHFNKLTVANDNARGSFQRMGQALAAVQGPLGPIAGRLSSMGSLVGGVGIAVGLTAAAFSVLAVSAYKGIGAFKLYEEELLATNAIIKATGSSAGITADDIEKMATDIGNITEVRKAGVELLKFGNISGDVFKRAMVAADDLSASGFGSISSAAFAVGKALTAPEEGLTRLKRAGIVFTDVQIAMAKRMVEAGDKAKAQTFVLDVLAGKVGGVGEARDQGVAGAYEALSDSLQRSAEQWGKVIATMTNLTGIIKALAGAIDFVTTKSKDPFLAIDTAIAAKQRTMESLQNSPVTVFFGMRKDTAMAVHEKELNALREQRAKIERDVAEALEDSTAAQDRQNKAAKDADDKRKIDLINGVVDALGRETEMLRKNALERAVEIELRKAEAAGVKSAGQDEIRRAVNTKMATEATVAAVEAAQLQNATLKNEKDALGLSVGAAAAYRMEYDFIAQQKVKWVTLSEKQLEALRKEATAHGVITQALALEKIQRDIAFERKTMFLSDEDVQIATRLRDIYPDVATALGSAQAEAIRLNNALKEIKDISTAALSGFAKDIANGVKPMDAMVNQAKRLQDIFIDMAAKRIVNEAMGAAFGGLTETASGTAGATAAGTIWTTAGATFNAAFLATVGQGAAIMGVATEVDNKSKIVTSTMTSTQTLGVALQEAAIKISSGLVWKGIVDAASAVWAFAQQNWIALIVMAIAALAAAVGIFGGGSSAKKQQQQQAEEQTRQQRARDQFDARNLRSEISIGGMDPGSRGAASARLEMEIDQMRQTSDRTPEIELLTEQVIGQKRLALKAEWDQKELDQEREHQKALLEEAERAAEEIARRTLTFSDRVFAATNDPSTLAGARAAQERQFQRERLNEQEDGGQLMNDLLAAQMAERLQLEKSFHDKEVEAVKQAEQQIIDARNSAARSIVDYLNNLISGPASTLAPQDALANAQRVFDANLALAKTGDIDAANKFPQLADNLEKAARAVFASSQGYQDIRNQIIAQGLTLPAVQQTTDPVVVAMRDAITAIHATTGAVNATTGSVDIATAAVNTTGASNDQLMAAQNALVSSQTTYLASQAEFLGAIRDLSDRFVTALNAHGVLTSNVGNTHTSQLNTVISLLAQQVGQSSSGGGNFWNWLGFQRGGVIPGFAGGGVVGNGMRNIDSVLARFAGGGNIMLAGGEGIINQQATDAIGGKSMVNFINRTRSLPSFGGAASNDNGPYFERLGARLERAIAGAAMAEINSVREENVALRGEVSRLTRATEANKPVVRSPGTKTASAGR